MSVRILAINGSPRTKCNTATLLNNALQGAASQGAETELVHLYKLNFKGCISCFSCKLKDGESYGRCAVNDELTPILKKVEDADALILGSPIYLGTAPGEMRSFMERSFGEAESLFVTDTYQFDDYSKYESSRFNVEEKAKRRREEFPNDCKRAYDMGVRFAQTVGTF